MAFSVAGQQRRSLPLGNVGTNFGPDLNSPEGLLALAQQQGGAIGMKAQELAGHNTGILSTIGSGFKKSFDKFVDIISTSSQVVAGIISPDVTIGQAIRENISPSDVILGEADPDASIMRKTGSFFTRTAIDILTDPLTYVTFGASQGIFGVQAATKITLGAKGVKGAKTAGVALKALKTGDATVALAEEGSTVFKYLKALENQALGRTSADNIVTQLKNAAKGIVGDTELQQAEKQLQKLMAKEVLDAPLNPDFAKKALSKLIEGKPQLAKTLLDKGGIKVFGKTILSSQRIAATGKLIPGMTKLDELTAPVRGIFGGLFDPAVVKVDGEYVRMPEEYVDLVQKARDFKKSASSERIQDLTNIARSFKLNANESRLLTANLEAGIAPADKRLAQAWYAMQGFDEQQFTDLQKAGVIFPKLDNHVPHILVQESKVSVSGLPFKTPPKQTVEASLKRRVEKFVDIETGKSIGGKVEKLGLEELDDAARANLRGTVEFGPEDKLFRNENGQIFKQERGTIFSTDPEDLRKFEKAVLSENQKVIDDTIAELKNSGFEGFEDNIIIAQAHRTFQNTAAETNQSFMKSIAKNFGVAENVANEAFRPIAVKTIKEEAGKMLSVLDGAEGRMVFHPAVAKHVEDFIGKVINDAPTNDLLKSYDKLLNMWKASVTTVFPAFHGRNAISNVFLHYLDIGLNSLNPATHAMAGQMLYWDSRVNKLQQQVLKKVPGASDELERLLTKELFTDSAGTKWTFGDIRAMAKKNDVAFTPNLTGAVDVQKTKAEQLKALSGKKLTKGSFNPLSQNFLLFEGGREVGTRVEQQARLVDFLTNLKKTGDLELASKRTKQFLFDYNNLTDFERTFMRRIIPFYSFTRFNLERQVKTLLTTPGRISQEITAVTNIGDVLSGSQISPEMEEKLPDWMKSGLRVLASQKGQDVSILRGFGTPIEQPFEALKPNQLLGAVSPLIRVPIEQGAGYSFFHGKVLTDVTNASAFKDAPKVVKDFIGFTEVTGTRKDGTKYTWYESLRPERMHLVNNLPLVGRTLSSVRQIQDETADGGAKILQQLTGIKAYSFNLNDEELRREFELKQQLENLLTKAGITSQFNRTYIKKPKNGGI